jgi:hypothetical protein
MGSVWATEYAKQLVSACNEHDERPNDCEVFAVGKRASALSPQRNSNCLPLPYIVGTTLFNPAKPAVMRTDLFSAAL